MKCGAVDPVWDRQCQLDLEHSFSTTAGDRLHVNDDGHGDKITWGSVSDMRVVERGQETPLPPPRRETGPKRR